jgi:hypothetical protein
VRLCHAARKGSLFSPLQMLSGQDQSRYQQFEQLHKLLYKLGKHVTICHKLIDAVVLLPQDFGPGFQVRTVNSSRLQAFPIPSKETKVEAIAGRMFRTPEEKAQFMNKLSAIWDTEELLSQPQDEIKTKTKVHAELLLVNHFERAGGSFLGGRDKYIGCSKPACYLCYAYIRQHPGLYTLPASHQKLYISWRMPDIFESEPHCHERLIINEEILMRMITEVRWSLTTEIASRGPRFPFHPDSTAGITSSGRLSIFGKGDEMLSNFDRLDISTRSMEIETNDTDSEDEGGVRLI